MSLFDQAYVQGQNAAFEKFAVALGTGALMPKPVAAPTSRALASKAKPFSFARTGENTTVQGQQAAVRAANNPAVTPAPAAGAQQPGLLRGAWNTATQWADKHPMLAQTGLMLGAPLAIEGISNMFRRDPQR